MTISLEEHVARALWLDEYPDMPWESSARNEQIKDDYRGHARAAIAAVQEHEGSEIARLKIALGEIANKRGYTEISHSALQDAYSDMRRIAKAALNGSPAPDPAEAMRARCEAIARAEWEKTRHPFALVADRIITAIAALKGNGEGK